MADETGKVKPVGVYVLGVDKAENNGPIYDALGALGFAWCGQALSLNEGLRQLKLLQEQVQLIVVRAELARGGEEAALLEPLAAWPLAVLIGAARIKQRDELGCLPNVRAVISTPPYEFSALQAVYRELFAQLNPASPAPVLAAAPVAAPNPSAPTRVDPPPVVEVNQPGQRTTPSAPPVSAQRARVSRLRIGFYGSRGGAGTSTAALQAAQLLAASGMKVALFDARQRGDLHLMLGERPAEQPLQKAGLTVYLAEPTEEVASAYEAIVIDGGRQHGTFNAQWIEVQHPVDESALRRYLGLPPLEQPGGNARPTRRLSLPRLFSIEVVE
jgi:hypothetical protein